MKLPQIYTLLFVQYCTAFFYPPLFWHKDNCGFRRIQYINGTKEFYIQVVPNNGMNVVCPNQVTVNNWLKDEGISSPTLFENMWLVDKQSYDQCKVGDTNTKYNRQILVCDQPRQIKYISLLFHPRFNPQEPSFSSGEHYYFISTSRGVKDELTTRKVSGTYGSCERYHMKLHIYVCDPKKEDCEWQIPFCDPYPELYRDMRLIDGKLPAPTKHAPKTTPTIPTLALKSDNGYLDKFSKKIASVNPVTTTSSSQGITQSPICEEKSKGTSIHLILNFVLGGIALFMAIVIIVLVFGLSGRRGTYDTGQRLSNVSSTHDPKNYLTMEIIQLPDGNTQLSPVMISRTPPISPTYLIDPQPRRAVQPHFSHNTPSESEHSHDKSFVFPERRHSYSGTPSTSSTRNSNDVPIAV